MLSDVTFVQVCRNDEGIVVCEYRVKYHCNALVRLLLVCETLE